jgi:cysteine-rich repeat protein
LPLCGNFLVEGLEQCDDGDQSWHMGEGCRADCSLVLCGDADDSGALSARDSLFMLRAAVGVASCEPCVCDVDDTSGPPTATDALRLLRVAIGVPLEIRCPSCR